MLLFWEGGDDVLKFVEDYDPALTFSPKDPNYPFRTELNSLFDQVEADIGQAINSAHQKGLTVYVATYFDLIAGNCKPALLNILLPQQTEIANQYVESA